jgi:hypothetical protein
VCHTHVAHLTYPAHCTSSQPPLLLLVNHVFQYKGDKEFAEEIVTNTRRYVELFSDVIDELVRPEDNAIRSEEVADVLLSHRLQQIAQATAGAEGQDASEIEAAIPPLPTRLMRRCVAALLLLFGNSGHC